MESRNESSIPQKNPKLQPLFFARSPKTIKYASSLDKLTNPQEIPTQKFAAQHQFEWTDTMWIDEEKRNQVWQDKTFKKSAMTVVEDRLHNPLDNLVICKINDMVGHGVFLSPQAKPLPTGTILGIYSGTILEIFSPMEIRQDSNKKKLMELRLDDSYKMKLFEDEHKNSVLFNLMPFSSAIQKGNICRFLQDLPEEDVINQTRYSSLIKNNIATMNVCVYPTVYYGTPVCMAITFRQIQPGEQLGLPYQGNYWDNKTRCVFNKNGNTIGYFEENKLKIDSSYQASEEMITPKINETEAAVIFQSLLLSPNLDNFNFKIRFVENVNFALTLFAKRLNDQNEASHFIDDLKKQFNQEKTCDQRFLTIKNKFGKNELSEETKTKLIPLKSELIFYMNQYNSGKQTQGNVDEPAFDQNNEAEISIGLK